MIRRLLRLAAPVWPLLVGSFFARAASLLAGTAMLAVPAIAMVAAAGGRGWPIFGLLGLLVAIALLQGSTRYLEHYLGHRAAFELLARMRVEVFDAVAPLSADDEEASADLTTIATRDIDRIEVFFAHTLVPAAAAVLVPAIVVAGVAAAAGAPAAAVAGAAFALGALVVPFLGAPRTVRAARAEAAVRARIADHLAADADAAVDLRTLGAENARMARLAGLEEELARAAGSSGRASALRAGVGLAWPFAAAIGILALATPPTLGSHVVAAVAVLGAAPAVGALAGLARSLPAALASARRYLAAFDRTPSVADPPRPAAVPSGPLGLRVEGASVAPPGGRRLLDPTDLDVAAGDAVAIVGPSGAGKSTLVSLIVRRRDPSVGRVVLVGDGRLVDVRDVALADLRAAVTLVEQRPVFVAGSVLDNLRLGNPALTEAEAWRALEDAALAGDIRAHAEGLAARLGEDALNLSGGQRQRLAIARALARRPRILVLDESTSHQDPETQRAVQEGIARRGDTTLVLVAHRAEAIRGVAHVVELPACADLTGHPEHEAPCRFRS
ncbi:ABC transporter ATP-binding protein [Microbacterium sp. ZXX196]|uniref:ATP-binding cassette domain-containing protein n=1 Tax=Microbacterium sp. ZXX196 TaxID=2609291 RepID=UPI0012B9061A|nr:ABC transporter ATP-binding protein [Microbacterium sp. ZXX196]MTE24424.1 ATP-binding cassette domain-containing protein [Microbacterium sp. ZXX196]